ncbi:hypothetical protein [Dapis sp. BLCC M229]|nr:hypothetical protein [Trichodesmium sp. MO_231.B1]
MSAPVMATTISIERPRYVGFRSSTQPTSVVYHEKYYDIKQSLEN